MKTLAKRPPESYIKLVRKFPLRHIATEDELNEATAVMLALTDRLDELDEGERTYLDALTDLVERYEQATVSIPPVPDKEMLRHLMEAKGVRQTEVAHATAIAHSTISEVLAGKRKLTRGQIGKLALYFGVGVAAFTPNG